MERNVGGVDRLARGGLAVVAAVVGLVSLLDGQLLVALAAGLAAAGFGFNAASCFCGVNQALGLDTTRE